MTLTSELISAHLHTRSINKGHICTGREGDIIPDWFMVQQSQKPARWFIGQKLLNHKTSNTRLSTNELQFNFIFCLMQMDELQCSSGRHTVCTGREKSSVSQPQMLSDCESLLGWISPCFIHTRLNLLWAILARWSRFTQEILLRGLGVLKTTMMLTGRPDLGAKSRRRNTLISKATHL